MVKCFKIQCDSCITLNILETVDFYASDGWISWYVNHISHKKKSKEAKKNFNRHFTKEAIKMSNKPWKDTKYHYWSGKCKLKPWWDTTAQWTELKL